MRSAKVVTMEKASTINIGIEEQDRKAIAQAMSRILASSYAVFLKTQYYHWNVVGAEFYNLHVMFEKQYRELFEAIDEIAERIRALGGVAPGTYHEFAELNFVKEDQDIPGDWHSMVENLGQGHEQLASECRLIIQDIAETGDEGSIDLLTERMKLHEKTAWMLRSLLKNNPTQ